MSSSVEIERKFLVRGSQWRDHVKRSIVYRQGYVANSPAASVRVRIGDEGARLNLKGTTVGVSRREFEYAIPVEDAGIILDELCDGPLVEKTRHLVEVGDHEWEIDEFAGANAGLIVAEIELAHENEAFERPAWAGTEVSEDVRFYNARLAKAPFSAWPEPERASVLAAMEGA